MQTLLPEQATLLLQISLAAFQNEHRATRRVIEAIPLDRGDYRPDAVSKSALDLAWHIAASENFFMTGIAAGAFNYAQPGRPESVRNSADIAAWHAETFQTNMARLSELSGEQLVKVMDFRGLFQQPAVMFLQVSLNHSIHHRGQLSTYLRPMGAKVPSIYGESHDHAEARKAAQK
ncbi:MAG TPA: DinB family protein [Bryobacteraceae bacterium]|nr:DinB family protein [Bryobacteraceae bacterium]